MALVQTMKTASGITANREMHDASDSAETIMTTPPAIVPTTGTLVVSAFQLLFGMLGLVGNMACFMSMTKRSRNDHTSWLLANQFAIDLLTSAFLIANTVHLTWFGGPPIKSTVAGELYCRLWTSGLVYFIGFAISSFNLAALSIERFVAVVHPLWYSAYFKQKTKYVLAMMSWFAAPAMEVVLIVTFHKYTHGECILTGADIRPIVGTLVFVWEFLVPMAIMTYSFSRIALKFRHINRATAVFPAGPTSVHETCDQPSLCEQKGDRLDAPGTAAAFPGPSSSSRPAAANAPAPTGGYIRRRNITFTLFIFFFSYVICWIPNQTMYLLINFGFAPNYYGSVSHSLTVVLATLNICINPLVYLLRYLTSRKGRRLLRMLCSSAI
ncbi:neuropeptide FF receptor 1-like [Diadema antillarum]|uniref:neuropeptide FF receptor 1-like n=1 Tax=Diadema antillarum TaxID=105358 RepID=UPI003A84BAB9